MKRKIILIIEIVCVFSLIILFFGKHFGWLPIGWTIVVIPLIVMGIIRSYIVLLIGVKSLSTLFRWLKWRITGKVTIKKKIGKRKRGHTRANRLKK